MAYTKARALAENSYQDLSHVLSHAVSEADPTNVGLQRFLAQSTELVQMMEKNRRDEDDKDEGVGGG